MNFQDKINRLIALYLNNELSGEEKKFVENWCKENPEEYEFIRGLYEQEPETIPSDVDEAWEKVNNRMAFRKNSTKRWLLFYSSVAASILLVAGLFYLLYPTIKTTGNSLMAEELNGTFTSSDSILHCSLPDGSEVTLQKNSRLTYRWKEGSPRNTALQGEAFFEVKHNEKRAFIVTTKHQQVTVLGTSFVVNTAPLNGYEVVFVNTGKVRVQTLTGNHQVNLVKGERSMLNENGLQKEIAPNPNEYAWATQELNFQNSPLTEVANILSKNFNKDVVLEKNGVQCRVTAHFRQESLDEIISELSAIIGFNYKKTDNGYLIFDIRCP